MHIAKTYIFDAAHFLPGHSRCGKVHGHTWKLNVGIGAFDAEGQLEKNNGMLLDFNILNTIVREILEDFDHKLINRVVPFTPTCENLVKHFKDLITASLPNEVFVHHITLQEGEGGWAQAD